MKRRSRTKVMSSVLPVMAGMPLQSLFLLILSLFLMIFSSQRPDVFEGVRVFASDALAPALSVTRYPFEKMMDFIDEVSSFSHLQADNARLTQENEDLRQWYHMAMLLQSENQSFRDLLNVKLDPNYEHITARVIGDSGSTFVKSILVLAGKDDGLEKGQAVVSGDGLVGRTIEVGGDTARILLVTDMNSRVPIVIGDTLQNAVMTGTNTNRPQLIHLPQDSEIAAGARIVTSGDGGIYPPGLPIGRVEIGENGEKLVKLFADMNSIHMVRVIRVEKNKN